MNIALGSRVRCAVTGFTGIATSRCEYINGCVQYGVTPPVVDNKHQDCQYIDERQLVVEGEGVTLPTAKTGGPRADRPPY